MAMKLFNDTAVDNLVKQTSASTDVQEIKTLKSPTPKGGMPILELLKEDRKRNYHGDEPQADELFATLEQMLAGTDTLYRVGNTLFLCEDTAKKELLWHTANADSPDKLIENTRAFLMHVKRKGYKKAVTYYDYKRITQMFKSLGMPVTTKKVDEGKYKTYRAEVTL